MENRGRSRKRQRKYHRRKPVWLMGIALVAVAVLAGTGIYALAGRLSLNMEKKWEQSRSFGAGIAARSGLSPGRTASGDGDAAKAACPSGRTICRCCTASGGIRSVRFGISLPCRGQSAGGTAGPDSGRYDNGGEGGPAVYRDAGSAHGCGFGDAGRG